MRKDQILTRILRELAHLVAEEAEANESFATKLDIIIGDLGAKKKRTLKAQRVSDHELPDVFAAALSKTDEELEMWLGTLDLPVLKAIVRKHEFDASKRTQRWREPQKFAQFITSQLRSRLRRGASFLSPNP